MTNAQPGWYPDPAGNTGKLRYWDGTQWTEHYAEPQPAAGAGAAGTGEAMGADAGAAAETAGSAGTSDTPGASSPDPSFVTPPRPTTPPAYTTASFVGAAPYGTGSASYGGAPYGNPTTPTATAEAPYAPAEEDRTLRLIAFVFAVLCTVSVAWAIIPLAWMIPMTVRCWGIYKGTKPNTVAFGVCTLIFLSLVGGILLLVSKKDQ